MDERLIQWRAETPGCATRTHLNNAGAGLMPNVVLNAITNHLQCEAEFGGYESEDEAEESIQAAYAAVARLTGAQSRNIAIVENSTVAFFQALAAFDFAPGDVIVTTRNDYVSNQLTYLSLARRRQVEIRRAADLPEGGVDPQSVRELLRDPRVKLLAVTWIPTNSGLVQPVEELGAIAEAADVPYLLDACQAVGQLDVDVNKLRCDFLAATARKFLRGPRGIGFLCVSDRVLHRGSSPLFIDLRAAKWLTADTYELAPDARRFENWEFAYILVLGMGAAARYALSVGMDEAERRACRLAAMLREKLQALPGFRVLDRGARLAAIVTAEVKGHDVEEIVHRLRAQNINIHLTLRESAVIDMDEKNARSGLRISPHYYNTEGEIEAVVEALRPFSSG